LSPLGGDELKARREDLSSDYFGGSVDKTLSRYQVIPLGAAVDYQIISDSR
jgi:hypothetical protein